MASSSDNKKQTRDNLQKPHNTPHLADCGQPEHRASTLGGRDRQTKQYKKGWREE